MGKDVKSAQELSSRLKNIILTDYLEFCRDIEPEKSDGLLAPNKEKWP